MRGLRISLCLFIAVASIVGMLPIAPALAAGPDLFGNEGNSNLQQDGLIKRLLDLGDDDEEDDDDDNEGNDDDEDDDDDGKGHEHDHHGKDRPEAYDQVVELDEDGSIRIELEGEADDRDDPITFAIVDEPENGELSDFDESGKVTYQPAANYYGSDNFTFRASDGEKESRTAIVTVRISSVNDVPVALSAQVTTTEGKSVSLILKGEDVESEELDFDVLSEPEHGTLSGNTPNLEYNPDNNFDGTDELSFKVNDGSDDSETATVKIVVKQERRNDKDDPSDRWWENPPVKEQSPEPLEPKPALNETTTNNSTQTTPTAAPQPEVVATPTPVIPQKPVVNAVLTPKATPTVMPAAAPIIDAVAPQLILPGSLIEVFTTSEDGAIVTYAVKAIDDVDGEIEPSCSPGSGSILPLGKFDIICEAKDAAGNSVLSSFMVVVSQTTGQHTVNSPVSFLFPALLTVVLGAGTFFGFRTLRHRLHRYPVE